jgi:hypothetical protein
VEAVRDVMLEGQWFTLAEISKLTGIHEPSISTSISKLRNDEKFIVRKCQRGTDNLSGGAIWQYLLRRAS